MSNSSDRNITQLQITLDAIDESKRQLLEDGPLSQKEADRILEEWNNILKERCGEEFQ